MSRNIKLISFVVRECRLSYSESLKIFRIDLWPNTWSISENSYGECTFSYCWMLSSVMSIGSNRQFVLFRPEVLYSFNFDPCGAMMTFGTSHSSHQFCKKSHPLSL